MGGGAKVEAARLAAELRDSKLRHQEQELEHRRAQLEAMEKEMQKRHFQQWRECCGPMLFEDERPLGLTVQEFREDQVALDGGGGGVVLIYSLGAS